MHQVRHVDAAAFALLQARLQIADERLVPLHGAKVRENVARVLTIAESGAHECVFLGAFAENREEGGARVGYVNPDQVTIDYLRGKKYAPQGGDFDAAAAWWLSLASDADAPFDDEVRIDAAAIRPRVTWGINPGQSVFVDEVLPRPADRSETSNRSTRKSETARTDAASRATR